MNLEIRGPQRYPMHIFWNGEMWLDVIAAGYSGVKEWCKELRAAGHPMGIIHRAPSTEKL